MYPVRPYAMDVIILNKYAECIIVILGYAIMVVKTQIERPWRDFSGIYRRLSILSVITISQMPFTYGCSMVSSFT